VRAMSFAGVWAMKTATWWADRGAGGDAGGGLDLCGARRTERKCPADPTRPVLYCLSGAGGISRNDNEHLPLQMICSGAGWPVVR
jgi:hypothetical protein